MKKSVVNFRRLFVLFSLCCLIVTPFAVMAEEPAPEVDSAIMEMIAMHDKALSEHNLDGVMSTYSKTHPIILMGTGPGERWTGEEEIADAYSHFFMDFDQGTLSTECTWHSISVQGDLAWIMAMCNFTDYMKNVKREYAVNISAVLEKTDNSWYFATFHYSNLTDF